MDKGLADPVNENEGDLAAGDFLVLTHMLDQAVGIPKPFRKRFKSSREPDQSQVTADAVGILHWTKPKLHRQIEGEAQADRHRFAMQDLIAISAFGFQRMCKSVAEVEEGALAALAFIARDDRGLCRATGRNGMSACGAVAVSNRRGVIVEPGKETGIVDKAVFHHLGIAGLEFAPGQGRKYVDIGDDQAR